MWDEIRLKGFALSGGIAIGHSFFHSADNHVFEEIEIHPEQIDAERIRFQNAIKLTVEDLITLSKRLTVESMPDDASIIEAQIYLLADPLFTGEVEQQIGIKLKKVEFLLQSMVEEYRVKFERMTDPYFKERFKDIQDVSRRLFSYLRKGVKQSLPDRASNSILFMDDLTPSETVEASHKNVLAIVTERGSAMAHAAILARAREIPYMTNIPISMLMQHAQSCVIVDGKKGELIINPTEKTLAKYKKLLSKLLSNQKHLTQIVDPDVKTIDGYQVRLFANIENKDEIDQIHQFGGHGIGLFRSENILVNRRTLPSEDEQFEIYSDLITKMNGLPVTIRVFDIGRDKAGIDCCQNLNAGFRSVGCLNEAYQIYMTQLRAIFRARESGPISVLFPMISSLDELREAKAMTKIAAKAIKCSKKVKIGCMIEVPSAALTADLLAKECDFFSIGTNDLVQYTLAVDRCDYALSHLYQPSHPCIIRLIFNVAREAEAAGIPLSICGEIAADPRYTALLLGLGVKELSVATRSIPLIRETIKGLAISDCRILAKDALLLSTTEEINALLDIPSFSC